MYLKLAAHADIRSSLKPPCTMSSGVQARAGGGSPARPAGLFNEDLGPRPSDVRPRHVRHCLIVIFMGAGIRKIYLKGFCAYK